MFEKILQNTAMQKPIVHCITNYASINDCANIILAVGGLPFMAESPDEAAEVTAKSGALVINTGMLTQQKLKAMLISGKTANSFNIPVVLDPVGVGASQFRINAASSLLQNIHFSVIRGNLSEIKSLCGLSLNGSGVDVSEVDAASGIDETIAAAKALNHKTNAVIAVTGKTDIVTDGKKVFAIHNGCPLMKKITGAGCMLTAVAAAFCAANKNDVLNSAAAAVGAFGLSGELAYKMLDGKGDMTGSYKIHLIDCMSIMTGEILRGGLKIEHR